MSTNAGINPESVAAALKHLADPTLHLVTRDSPPPSLPERAAAILMAQAAGVIERLLEEAANHLHRLWTEAKDAGQRHADERDAARTELAALQDALHRDGTIYAAIVHLGAGHRVRRAGWNGKGMWLTLVRPDAWHADMVIKPDGATKLPWVGMRTADGGFVPWLCSQTDLLARDWEVAD